MSLKDDPQRAARDLVVVNHNGRDVAMNLLWRTVMQAGEKQPAIMAREAGASHYCSVNGTVGYGKLPKTRNGLRLRPTETTPITPVAMLAARRIGNTAALLALDIGNGNYWLCSIRNGLPFGPESFVTRLAQLLALLQEASDRAIDDEAEAFTLFTDAIPIPGSDSEGEGDGVPAMQFAFPLQPLTLVELLLEQAAPGDVLQPVGSTRASGASGATGDKPGSSKFKSVLLGLGVPLLLAYGGYSYYQQDQEEKAAIARAEALLKVKPVINPEQLWQQALQAATKNRHAADALLLPVLRTSLGKVPVDWLGWKLKTVTCSAVPVPVAASKGAVAPMNPPSSPSSPWNCVANYEAPRAQLVATNAQLLAALPAGFSATFIPTTKAMLSWQVPHSAAPLDAKVLPSQSQALIDLGSALQTLAPALSEPPTFAFVPLPDLVAPKDDAGVTLIRPVSIETPLMATLNLKGPLRTLDTIIQSGIAADWNSLAVHLSDTRPVVPDLVSTSASASTPASALTFELMGVVYAKN